MGDLDWEGLQRAADEIAEGVVKVVSAWDRFAHFMLHHSEPSPTCPLCRALPPGAHDGH